MVVNDFKVYVVDKGEKVEYTLIGEIIVEEGGRFYAIPLMEKRTLGKDDWGNVDPVQLPNFISSYMEKAKKVSQTWEIDENKSIISQRDFYFN